MPGPTFSDIGNIVECSAVLVVPSFHRQKDTDRELKMATLISKHSVHSLSLSPFPFSFTFAFTGGSDSKTIYS